MGRTNSVLARNLQNTFARLEFLKNLTDLLRFESFTFHNTLLKLSIIFLFSNSLFFREAYKVTEELECEPAKFYIKRYIRYKYAAKSCDGVKIGELPERVIDKGIAGAGLLAMILTDKYVDHLPLYRQKQRFARENIRVPSSTIEGWTKEALIKLHPLYEQLVFDTKAKGYLQVDETPIKVLDSDKKGAAHQGYYWVYHAPLDGTVLFDYS